MSTKTEQRVEAITKYISNRPGGVLFENLRHATGIPKSQLYKLLSEYFEHVPGSHTKRGCGRKPGLYFLRDAVPIQQPVELVVAVEKTHWWEFV